MQMHGMDFKNQIPNSLYLGVCLGVLGASAVALGFVDYGRVVEFSGKIKY
jgi:hypothetical protein